MDKAAQIEFIEALVSKYEGLKNRIINGEVIIISGYCECTITEGGGESVPTDTLEASVEFLQTDKEIKLNPTDTKTRFHKKIKKEGIGYNVNI